MLEICVENVTTLKLKIMNPLGHTSQGQKEESQILAKSVRDIWLESMTLDSKCWAKMVINSG